MLAYTEDRVLEDQSEKHRKCCFSLEFKLGRPVAVCTYLREDLIVKSRS